MIKEGQPSAVVRSAAPPSGAPSLGGRRERASYASIYIIGPTSISAAPLIGPILAAHHVAAPDAHGGSVTIYLV